MSPVEGSGAKQRFSPYESAIRIASIVHSRQRRKRTMLPYVSHVVAVSHMLAEADAPATVVLAGLLHDVLEDFEYDEATCHALTKSFPSFDPGQSHSSMAQALRVLIDNEVGHEVRWLVEAVTEKKVADDKPRTPPVERPWKIRKLEQLRHLLDAAPGVAALKGADTLHNIQSIIADSRTTDGAVFERFNASPDDLVWYYGVVCGLCAERLDGVGRLRPLLEHAGGQLEAEVNRALGPRDRFTGRRERGNRALPSTTLVVEGGSGRIVDVDSWRGQAPPARPGHWKPRRSAMESARSWFAREPNEPRIPCALRALLDSHTDTADAVLHTVHPEGETNLDEFGSDRQQGVLAYGLAGERRL